MQFEDYEDKTGLKFAFNILPRTKIQEKKCTIPLSCLYQPLRPKDEPIIIESYPMACMQCRTILNPFCIVDSNSRSWSCSVCGNRNQFPNNMTQLPVELNPDLIDVEYIIPSTNGSNNELMIKKPTVFVFIIDLAIDNEELDALKESLINSIGLLPPNSMISIITYGKHVNVHEIGFQDYNTFYTFNGNVDYTREQVDKKLGIIKKNMDNLKKLNNLEIVNRFVQQTSICEFSLIKLIESLKQDSFKPSKYHRRERSTGTAINIAFHMLSTLYPKIGSRIMLFTGGACTIGPGSIVSTDFKDPIRSHHNLLKDSKINKMFMNNVKFYQNIAEKASINGHTFDIFIGCYDQIGLSEMECLVDKTGGVVVQTDSFTSAIFKQSLQKFLSINEYGESQFGLNATLEIKCNNLKVKGFIGHGTPIYVKNNNNNTNKNNVQPIKFYTDDKNKNGIGISGTNVFKIGSVSTHSSYAIYFDLNERVVGDYSIIQFITTYQHPDGSQRIHVTTSQRFINQSVIDSLDTVIEYFDQEAATVLIAREAIFKVKNGSSTDALNLTNKILIDFMSTFCKYSINDPNSIIIPPSINLLPQFIYHLRRSNFIQIFNSSPDETSFYRHCFFTEDCINTLIMIQPTLTSYELEKEPESVLLDSTSIKNNRILFLDTFFHILIYHGSLIAEWRRQGYQNQPEYEYLKEFLELPRQEAADILVDRFPLPRFIDTEEGGSQARFLMSKLNPTTSYTNSESLDQLARYGGAQDQTNGVVIMTDDISLQTFMQFVYEAVVKPS
jgi:protein transport protein SEC23